MSDYTKNMPSQQAVNRLYGRNLPSARKSPLSHRERYVLWAALPLVVICPWHGGSMLWWSNILNVILALLPVIAAFVMPITEEVAEQSAAYSRRQNLKNLLKFPIFWLGLLFLGYILIQALNYNWEFVWTENRRGFYMQKLKDDQYIHWLPSGMKSPFKMTSPWQALLMWAAPWLLVCTMWSTLKRRKAWCIVLWTVATVGAFISILGIAALITAPDKIFWIWDAAGKGPFGPYTYRNQASVYMYMAIASSVALFFYYQRMKSTDSGIQWFALLLGTISLGGAVMSFSRGGWIGTALILLFAIALFIFRLFWQRSENPKILLVHGLLLLLLASSGGYFVSKIDFSLMDKKWRSLSKQLRSEGASDNGVLLRKAAAKKTLEMFEDNKWTGWGASSFRFYFPVYQQGDDFISHPSNSKGKFRYDKRFFWTYAHSDWAQLLAEYGILGSSILLLGLFYMWGSVLFRFRSLHCEHWMLLIATIVMVFQGVLDIVFYNPSLVILFFVVLSVIKGLVRSRRNVPILQTDSSQMSLSIKSLGGIDRFPE